MAFSFRDREVQVRVGDLRAANDRGLRLAIHGLGSCVGVAMADAQVGVAGLAHVNMPWQRDLPSAHRAGGWSAADQAIPELLRRLRALGAVTRRLSVSLVGGASMGPPALSVGSQNAAACEAVLAELGLTVASRDLGGQHWRSVIVAVHDGAVQVVVGDSMAMPHYRPRPPRIRPPAPDKPTSVDDVVANLTALRAQYPDDPVPPRPRTTPTPRNVDEIRRLLDPLLPDDEP